MLNPDEAKRIADTIYGLAVGESYTMNFNDKLTIEFFQNRYLLEFIIRKQDPRFLRNQDEAILSFRCSNGWAVSSSVCPSILLLNKLPTIYLKGSDTTKNSFDTVVHHKHLPEMLIALDEWSIKAPAFQTNPEFANQSTDAKETNPTIENKPVGMLSANRSMKNKKPPKHSTASNPIRSIRSNNKTLDQLNSKLPVNGHSEALLQTLFPPSLFASTIPDPIDPKTSAAHNKEIKTMGIDQEPIPDFDELYPTKRSRVPVLLDPFIKIAGSLLFILSKL